MTVIAGENTFITGGTTTVYKTGESFVELPGVVGQARNAGAAPMAVMATYLQPRGEPLSHPAAPGLPNTGGGGGARDLPLGWLALAASGALAVGLRLARRRAGRAG